MIDKMEYYTNLESLGILKRVDCSKDEVDAFNKIGIANLPRDVFYSNSEYMGVRYYWRYSGADLPEDKIQAMVLVQTALNIKTIKKCVIFFTVLAVASLILSAIVAFM